MDTTDTSTFFEFLPGTESQTSRITILLAGENSADLQTVREALLEAGLDVRHATSLAEAEPLWLEHRHAVVLLDVDGQQLVPHALQTATRIKQRYPHQFLAYLADPILRTRGLAGDAIFARDARTLPAALLRCLAAERTTQRLP